MIAQMSMDQRFGRDREIALISDFLALTQVGPGILLIEGEAGIGKTLLWAEAVAEARRQGRRVLTARPAEPESHFGFCSLGDLVEPVLEATLPILVPRQRRALELVVLRDDGAEAVDRHAVSLALVGVLQALAREGPVLIAIDDVEWLDSPSAAALGFAIRRLDQEPVGLLLTSRSCPRDRLPLGLDGSFHLPAQRLEVGPLPLRATGQILRNKIKQDLTRPAVRRLHAAAGGNPLHALEIARALERRGTRLRGGEPLPVPQDLQDLVRDRLDHLPAGVLEVLLLAAALSRPTIAVLESALGTGGGAALAIQAAATAEVITVDGERIRFAHPLIASTIYWAAPLEARSKAHLALANAVSEAEPRAWHLALAAAGPDEAIAAVVSEAAGLAMARGAPESALELSLEALRLTPGSDAEAIAGRRSSAGEYLFWNGHTGQAAALLEVAVAEAPSGPAAAWAHLALGAVRFYTHGEHGALPLAERALALAGDDPGLLGACHAMVGNLNFRWDRAESHSLRALELLEGADGLRDRASQAVALITCGQAAIALGRGLAGYEFWTRAADVESRLGTVRVLRRAATQLGIWERYAGKFDSSRARLMEALRQAREEQDVASLPTILIQLAGLECWVGNWELASELAADGEAAAGDADQALAPIAAHRALIDACLGRVEDARRRASVAIEWGELNHPWIAGLGLRALGFLELSLGDPKSAVVHLEGALAVAGGLRLLEPGVYRLHGDAIEALLETGAEVRAVSLLEQLDLHTSSSLWSEVTAARCRGLLLAQQGRVDDGIDVAGDAVAAGLALGMPLELGRAWLVKGRLERRARRKRDAKLSLEQAVAIFDSLPAPLWALRARAELRRIGLRPPAGGGLTETEGRVAELAARGLTNRQVAEALFISPKTVEANMGRLYGKLGISSRAELGAAMEHSRLAAEIRQK